MTKNSFAYYFNPFVFGTEAMEPLVSLAHCSCYPVTVIIIIKPCTHSHSRQQNKEGVCLAVRRKG